MSISVLTEAAELEQALVAAEVMDQASSPTAVWGAAAHQAAFDRFGGAGEDLPYEYQNALYEIECGRPADVLFH